MSHTGALLAQITGKRTRQADVARAYAVALRSGEPVRWSDVNEAIIARWSLNGLQRIKAMAWEKVLRKPGRRSEWRQL